MLSSILRQTISLPSIVVSTVNNTSFLFLSLCLCLSLSIYRFSLFLLLFLFFFLPCSCRRRWPVRSIIYGLLSVGISEISRQSSSYIRFPLLFFLHYFFPLFRLSFSFSPFPSNFRITQRLRISLFLFPHYATTAYLNEFERPWLSSSSFTSTPKRYLLDRRCVIYLQKNHQPYRLSYHHLPSLFPLFSLLSCFYSLSYAEFELWL